MLMTDDRGPRPGERASAPPVTAPEFRKLCTAVAAYIRDGTRAQEMRSAVYLFAEAVRANKWTPAAILKALHGTPCYPHSIGAITNQRASKRYSQCIDFLMYDCFNPNG